MHRRLNPGRFTSNRRPYRRSCQSVAMTSTPLVESPLGQRLPHLAFSFWPSCSPSDQDKHEDNDGDDVRERRPHRIAAFFGELPVSAKVEEHPVYGDASIFGFPSSFPRK